MPINTAAADTSNGLLLSTVIIYAIAMLCYACDFAFAKHRVLAEVSEAADVAVPELVAAGAGGPAAASAGGSSAGGQTTSVSGSRPPAGIGGSKPTSRWPSGFWLRLAFSLTCVGVAVQVCAICTRGIAED